MKAFTVKGMSRALCVVATMLLAPAGGRGDSRTTNPAPLDPRVTAPAERVSEAYAAVAAHVMPSVVRVTSEMTLQTATSDSGDNLLGPSSGKTPSVIPKGHGRKHSLRQRIHGLGSGMILDHQGHVLTNYHVVRDASSIEVTLPDGRKFDAKVVGSDPQTDIAVIVLRGTIPKDLPTITLGDSDALRVGDVVLAIGAPFGLAQTVTSGIVSATGRADVGVANYEDLLQTDAPLNPGNSGGPLVNMHGEVVGMNTAIATEVGQSAGINFAIPSNMIKALLPHLTAGEKIVRGSLGVGIQTLTPELAAHFGAVPGKGVLISQVTPGSPAARAGIARGDVILSFAGHVTNDGAQLRNMVAATAPGTKVVLEVLRNGKPMIVTTTIGTAEEPKRAASAPQAGPTKPEQLGIAVVTLTPDVADQLGLDVTKGVLITRVKADGIGAKVGLQPGDVILEVDRTPVATVEELLRKLDEARPQHSALLLVARQQETAYVVVHW